MKSHHLVDPDLLPALANLTPLDLSNERLSAIRAAARLGLTAAPVVETPTVHVETLTVAGPPGGPDLRVLAYRPIDAAAPLPAFLHIHGGGYVIGSPEMADIPNRLLVADLGCAIYSVDYRLAPETPHPGPVEDCFAVLLWMQDNADELGLDRRRIGVKGESAGGGLAAALAILARDRGGPSLAFQHLIYPMIDDRTCTLEEPHPFVGDFVWTPERNHFGWSALLGRAPGGSDVSPYAAAARVKDVAGLPPTFLAVGGLDLFLEENLTYAHRLSRAGVPLELHVYPGAFHAFQRETKTRVAQAANRDSREALRRSLYP